MSFRVKKKKQGVCPACEEERALEVGTRRETLSVRNEPIEIEAAVERCTTCGEFFADLDEEEANFQQAYRIYRERHGLLQPEEIREIREQYGIGQRPLSRLLGWGEVTIHRYESGAIQDEVHNEVLLFLKDPENFRTIFEKNKDRLPPHTIKRVAFRLSEHLGEKSEDRYYELLVTLFGKARDDIHSGFRRFDLERFEAAVLYCCRRVPYVTKVKLNKLLWYCDFYTYKTLGRSATGAVYVHLTYGPVPEHYESYLDYMERVGMLEAEEIIYDEDKGILGDLYRATEDPDLSLFTDTERECLEKVAGFFKGMGAKAISDYSHQEEGWRKTQKGEILSYEWAKTLRF
jgi:putative zinc finger/helix-turn-helix YgiT family protein